MRTIRFKINYWFYKETDDNELFIYIGGLTKPDKNGVQKSVLIMVDNFHPYCFLELPKNKKWNKELCKKIFEYMKLTGKDYGPITYECMMKNNIYYNVPMNVMMMTFPTVKACTKAASGFKYYSKTIAGVGIFEKDSFKLHEASMDPILKLSTLLDIKMAGWIEVEEHIREEDKGLGVEERSFGTSDISMYVKVEDIKPVTEDISLISIPKYFSFDIECYSANHNSKIPDPTDPHNYIFQIGVTSGMLGNLKSRRKHLLTLGDCSTIEDVEVICYDTEVELLLGFVTLMHDINPDLLMGHNILKFDWDYMIARAQLLKIVHEFTQIGRVVGERCPIITKSWSSSAFGTQVFKYMECIGRLQIDTMPEIERNHRLPSYSLNTCAEHFLGEQKDDVSALQLFMLRKAYTEMYKLLKVFIKKPHPDTFKNIINCGLGCLKIRSCSGPTLTYRKKLKTATEETISTIINDAMKLVGSYCVQDTVLVVNLTEKLNLFVGMEEMANITNVPCSYLATRGQQIRVVAQILRLTIDSGHLIPAQNKDEDDDVDNRYEGATVIDPVPGFYKRVPSFDFASLYPSMIICYNICFTTIVADDDPISDDDCNVIIIDTHIACEHDPKKRKSTKKKPPLCITKRKYRFRKVVIHPDGSREFEGLMPRMLRNLLASRKLVKKEMAKWQSKLFMHSGKATKEDIDDYKKKGWDIIEKGSLKPEEEKNIKITVGVLDAKQTAIKVSANSAYGAMGAVKGFLPFIAGAACVTAEGRESIHKAIDYITTTYGFAKLVYGDSVTGDTPILIKRGDNKPEWVKIEDLNTNTPLHKEDKDVIYSSNQNLKVWSDKGWTPVNRIIKHYTTKRIFRVKTNRGEIDVTEDHSLLLPDGTEISPKNVNVGDLLMHHKLPDEMPCSVNVDEISPKLKRAFSIHKTHVDCIKYASHWGGEIPRITKDDTRIISIEDLGPCDDYVYDLETENHHFAAGIGHLVVHNTDSCMWSLGDDKTLDECFDIAEECVKRVSHYLKCSLLKLDEDFQIMYVSEKGKAYKLKLNEVDSFIKKHDINLDTFLKGLSDEDRVVKFQYDDLHLELAFETIYGKYLMLSKKRYICQSVNRKGEIMKTVKKGCVLARRDNCFFNRDSYSKIIQLVLNEKSQQEVYNSIYDSVSRLFTRQIPPEHLVIFMGVKDVISYSKKEEVLVSQPDKMGRIKKVKKLYFIDVNGERFDDPTGPNDPRLQLSNVPQALLCRKMIRRGDIIPANTRLEFLYLDMSREEVEITHNGERAEDYTYYKEHRKEFGLKPDLLYYLEKQFMKPISEVLEVKWPTQFHLYMTPDEAYADAVSKEKLDSIHTLRLDKCKKPLMKYRYVQETLSKKKYPKLFNAVYRLLAKDVLDRLYRQFKIPIRKLYNKPTKKKERETKMAPIGGDMIMDIFKARSHWYEVVKQYNKMFELV